MEFKDALLLFYIIMVAHYFEIFFSCDLQRLFQESLLFKHALAFVSAFFLITLVQNQESAKSLWELLRTTVFIYVLYILSTKAKAQFVFPMLIVLFADQLVRVQMDILRRRAAAESDEAAELQLRQLADVRKWLTVAIIGLIGVGAVHYYLRARREFGADFRHSTFFLGTHRCRGVLPDGA